MLEQISLIIFSLFLEKEMKIRKETKYIRA